MKISVFGIGYVGLVQAAVMAEVGHDVVCMDIDEDKIAKLKRGQISIFEPGLAELVKENLEAGRLHFTSDVATAAAHGLVQFIAVGTPPSDDGSANLSAVFAVAEGIARHRSEPVVIVEKSTVPVGTGDRIKAHIEKILADSGRTLKFDIVSNPEFLKEGSALADCRRPDRIIIGCDSNEVLDVMREIYAPFNRNHDRTITMNLRSAELTKYAANCMLATKISFINQIAELAEHLGADIESVRLGMGADVRIGYHFIYPGCGYGGSCFPKDVQALIHTAAEANCSNDLLRAVEEVNRRQKNKLFERIKAYYKGDLAGRTFALWGLSFKPNTDDMRDSPAISIIQTLQDAGATVTGYDPEGMENARLVIDNIAYAEDAYGAARDADALVIVTEWNQFRALDFARLKSVMKAPVLVDLRNIYRHDEVTKHGFAYTSVGRPSSDDTL